MTILITGSSGHLGEALARQLTALSLPVRGIDIKPSACTDALGSITDSSFVDQQMRGVRTVLHTATLHKPHVAAHSRQQFIDTNVTGTLNLLEAAARRLEPDGLIVFSTHARRFKLDERLERIFSVEDITARTIPRDFVRTPRIHQSWILRRHSAAPPEGSSREASSGQEPVRE